MASGKDMMVFVTRAPTPTTAMFTILYPLSLEVWLAVLVSLLLVQLALYLVSNLEERLVGLNLYQWSTYAKAGWYGFAALIGENITHGIKVTTATAWATRLKKQRLNASCGSGGCSTNLV